MRTKQVVLGVVGSVAAVAGLVALAWLGNGPDRAAIPEGETWWCYATPRGAGCARTGPECVAQLTLRAVSGLESCYTQPAAWCFTNPISDSEHRRLGTNWQCFPRREHCEQVREASGMGSRCGGVE